MALSFTWIKVGSSKYTKNADDQVTDYALDLKYFHEASKDRYLIPIVVATEGAVQPVSIQLMHDKISMPLHCSQESIATAITATLSILHDAPLSLSTWQNARYAPTPTIIEAAQAMYRNHSVYDLSRNDAGAQNLTATTMAINRIIDHCKRFHERGFVLLPVFRAQEKLLQDWTLQMHDIGLKPTSTQFSFPETARW